MTNPREIEVGRITGEIARLCGEANLFIPDDLRAAFERAKASEESPVGREVLERLLENADIAANEKMPYCQDCGLAVVFMDIGQDVRLVGGDLAEAVDEGVRQGMRRTICARARVTPSPGPTPATTPQPYCTPGWSPAIRSMSMWFPRAEAARTCPRCFCSPRPRA